MTRMQSERFSVINDTTGEMIEHGITTEDGAVDIALRYGATGNPHRIVNRRGLVVRTVTPANPQEPYLGLD